MNIGILGGGQLALMLAASAQKLGLHPLCWGASDCPAHYASKVTNHIQDFLNHSQMIIIENEFLDHSMEKLLEKSLLFPSLKTIKLFSNKLEQKKLLTQMGLPTLRYLEKPIEVPAKTWLKQIQTEFPKGCVIKWARMGYDGLGTYFLKTKDIAPAIQFIEKAKDPHLYAEEMIDFDKELSQVTALSTFQKTFYHFPLVETIQARGVCQSVYKYEDPSLSQKTCSYAEKLASSTQLFGTFAIEFFLKNQQLFINEIAPRVHNSGHWSQETHLSQFEAHLRAVLGWAFPENVKYPDYFGMHNILGQRKRRLEYKKRNIDRKGNPSIYWYGKKQLRPGRKLGHINFMTNDQGEIKYLDRLSQQISRWLTY